jgi:hypothetical protein
MTVNFFNGAGQIDLSLIRNEDVALLSHEHKEVLNIFIAAAIAKSAAEVQHQEARALVYACMKAETEAQAAHIAANPPPTQLEALRAAQASYRASHS